MKVYESGKEAEKMARYDEDLHENQFFNTLVTKYNIIFSEAAEKKWMVSGFVLRFKLSLASPRSVAQRDNYNIGEGGRGV